MCNYVYTEQYRSGSPGSCPWSDYYLGLQDRPGSKRFGFYDLPVDKDGRCLFHSTNIAWKREQQFWARWLELVDRLEEEPAVRDLDFQGFYFVGSPDLKAHDAYQKLGIKNKASHKILLSGRSIKKRLYLHDCTFRDNIFWENCKFHGGLECQRAVFKQVTNFKDCHFFDTVYFITNTRFEHNFEVENCTFAEIASFEEAVFQYRFQVANTTFKKQALFEKVYFGGELEVYAHFQAEFNDLTSFEGAGFTCPVHFDQCRFNAEIHFVDTAFRSRLEITDPVIRSNIFFTGTKPGVKLFQAAADFEFGAEAFTDGGQLIFENVNIFNLNSDFKVILNELERAQKVDIREGCILYRTSIQRIFPYTKFNQVILEDLARAFSGFFEVKHNRNLKVDLIRDLPKQEIRLIYHTEENITAEELEYWVSQSQLEALRLLQNPGLIREADKEKRPILQDYYLNIQNLVDRLAVGVAQGALDANLLKTALLPDGDVLQSEKAGLLANIELRIDNVEQLNILPMKINQKQTAFSLFGSAKNIATVSLNDEERNSAIQQLNELLTKLKESEEVGAEEKEELLELASDLKTRVENKEKVPKLTLKNFLEYSANISDISGLALSIVQALGIIPG